MKKILAISFAVLFLYQSVGYIVLQQIQQKRIQFSNWGKLIEETNSDEATLILNSNDTRIKFLNEHEIVFEGKQYDVKAQGNQLQCYRDRKEEKIISKLISVFSTQKKNESSVPLSDFFSKIFKKDYSVQKENLFVLNTSNSKSLLPPVEDLISVNAKNIFAPPPDFIS